MQLCSRSSAIFSQHRFFAVYNYKAFGLSDLSLLQSQDSLHHNMACIIYLILDIYTYSQSGCRWYWSIIPGAPGDGNWENIEMHMEAVIKQVGRFTGRPRSSCPKRCTWRR